MNFKEMLGGLDEREREDFLRYIPAYIAESGDAEQFTNCLTDYNYFETKMVEIGLDVLVNDFALVPTAEPPSIDTTSDEDDNPLELTADASKMLIEVQDTLRLLEGLVVDKPHEFSSQLWGALAGHEHQRVQKLLNGAIEARRHSKTPCWLRPLEPCMTQAGGALQRTFQGHLSAVKSIVVTPDGSKFLSAGIDKDIKVWEIETGNQINTLNGHSKTVEHLLLSRDGRKVISASADAGLILVHDLETGKQLHVFSMEDPERKKLREEMKEAGALLGGKAGEEYWMAAFNKTVSPSRAENSAVKSIALYGDHQILAGYSDGQFCCYDINSGETVFSRETIHHSSINKSDDAIKAIAVSQDNRFYICGSDEGLTIQYDGEEEAGFTWFEYYDKVSQLLLSQDDSFLFSVDGPAVKIWDVFDKTCVDTFAYSEHSSYGGSAIIEDIMLSPDGTKLILASRDHTVSVWDWRSWEQIAVFPGHISSVSAVALTPDGETLISGGDDGVLNIWAFNPQTRDETPFPHSNYVEDIAISQDGKIAVSGGNDGLIIVWNLATRGVLRKIDVSQKINQRCSIDSVALTPDGKKIVSANDDRKVQVWDSHTGEAIRLFESETVNHIKVIEVTPDGEYAVSGSQNRENFVKDPYSDWGKTLIVWKLIETKQKGNRFTRFKNYIKNYKKYDYERGIGDFYDRVTQMVLTPDGRTVLAGSDEGDCIVAFDFETGEKLFDIESASLEAMVLTSDGQRLIMACNAFLYVYNLQTKEFEDRLGNRNPYVRGGILRSHDYAGVSDLAVTADGQYAVSVAADRMIKVWDMETREEAASFTAQGQLYSCAVAPDGRTILAGDNVGRVYFFYLETQRAS